MENIDPKSLRERLIEVGYPDTELTDNSVKHLLDMKGDAAEMLKIWVETGRVPKFEAIEGIDKKFLRDILKMKDPAVIMAYGMLMENPKYNAMLLKRKAAELGKLS